MPTVSVPVLVSNINPKANHEDASMENHDEALNLESLESRLELEAASAAAPILPIECWCNN